MYCQGDSGGWRWMRDNGWNLMNIWFIFIRCYYVFKCNLFSGHTYTHTQQRGGNTRSNYSSFLTEITLTPPSLCSTEVPVGSSSPAGGEALQLWAHQEMCWPAPPAGSGRYFTNSPTALILSTKHCPLHRGVNKNEYFSIPSDLYRIHVIFLSKSTTQNGNFKDTTCTTKTFLTVVVFFLWCVHHIFAAGVV